jgi:hypothetical protein
MPFTPLQEDLYAELGSSIRGQVYRRDQTGYAATYVHFKAFAEAQFDRFADYSIIFNGNVVCPSKAVVVPLDAEDVSKCVLRKCSFPVVNLSVTGSFYSVRGMHSLLR